MRIAIDARWIFPEISGIGLYTQELVRAMAALNTAHEAVLLFREQAVLDRTAQVTGFRDNPRFSARLFPWGLFTPSSQIRLPFLLRSLGVDVYHSTNYMMPLVGCRGFRRVVTMHDLIPLLFRDHAPRSKKARLFPVFKRLMYEVGRRADLIVAVSESTRRDILRELAIAPERHNRVVTIHEACDAAFHAGASPEPRTKPRILYVGRRDPYKNLTGLIAAFGKIRAGGVDAVLRVVGSDDPRYPEARRLAQELQLDPHIEWAGYVHDRQLPDQYRAADVFALVSKYEGFGLTVLEAMGCGTPVVCGNTSSLPEVAGDAAILVDPADTNAIAAALTRVLTDPALAASMREKGLVHAARFSWRRAAEETFKTYETAAG
jgi:glycosyltransferase involved in cell wall biosynthesis